MIDAAFEYLAYGGRYVLIGLQKEEIKFSHPKFYKKEDSLMSSQNATREDFEHVTQSMSAGLIDSKIYNSHSVAFGDVKNDFKRWLDPASGVIKAIVEMD